MGMTTARTYALQYVITDQGRAVGAGSCFITFPTPTVIGPEQYEALAEQIRKGRADLIANRLTVTVTDAIPTD